MTYTAHYLPIEKCYPGMYVMHLGQGARVAEYPLATGQGVFVNLIGGEQLMAPLGTPVEVVCGDYCPEH